MADDDVAGYFRDTVNQYAQQIGPETAAYLMRTYQLGDHDTAFTSLVSTLVELDYNESELLQGPLSKLAQLLGVPTTWSTDADPSAIRRTDDHPDPFAEAAAALSPPQFRQTQHSSAPSATPAASPDPAAGQTQQLPQGNDGTLRIR